MILERYIRREIVEKIGWTAGLLILVLASNRFVEYLADAAAGKLPAGLIAQMLAMKLTAMLPRLLPVALFLAVMLALSRMARDRELVAVMGSGMSEGFQLAAVVRFSLLFAAGVAGASFYAAPWAEQRIDHLKRRAQVESDISGISAGQFREFGDGDRVVYVQRISEERNYMERVFLRIRQPEGHGVLVSDRARLLIEPGSGSQYIVFEDGHRYVGTPGTRDYQITEYRYYAVLLQQGEGGPVVSKLEAISTGALLDSGQPKDWAELQWRLSFVIASLLLPMLAVAMSRFGFTERRYLPIFIAVLLYFIYSNLLGISRSLVIREKLPPLIGLWWVHLLMVGGIVLIIKHRSVRAFIRRYTAPAPA